VPDDIVTDAGRNDLPPFGPELPLTARRIERLLDDETQVPPREPGCGVIRLDLRRA
jgi:hypothetical protein